jgi:aminoglycoside phosphotransferase (APT) family kinase protein
VHSVTVDDARGTRHDLVLRRFVRAEWLAEEPDLAEHEARVLELLAPSAVPAPGLVAVDRTGEECGAPAVLMTRVPGRLRWTPAARLDHFLTPLVDAMRAVHAVEVPAGAAIRRFRPYSLGRSLQPPPASTVPDAWAAAIEVHGGAAPAHEAVLVHRDFHPGNVLWQGEGVSAVVDWSCASVGAPEVDVSHCRANLEMRLGARAADRLLAIWRERSGRAEYDPYWDLQAAVGMLDPERADQGWVRALDDFVARAVAATR